MSCLSVLRLGSPVNDPASADMLQKALLTHFAKVKKGDEGGGGTTTTNEAAAGSSSELTITNRYFTARVSLKPAREEESTSKDNKQGSLPWKEDGIFLVFHDAQSTGNNGNNNTSGGFDALAAVHDEATEANRAGDLLRMCIGINLGEEQQQSQLARAFGPDWTGTTASTPSAGGDATTTTSTSATKDAEKEYSRRVLWCLDRGYEYVQADISEQGVLRGHDARDKDGFARIVEAISGSVWSSAVMAATKKKQLQQSFQHDKKEYSEPMTTSTDNTAGKEKGEEKDEENPYVPPDPSLLVSSSTPLVEIAEDSAREKKAREALLQQSDIDEYEYLDVPSSNDMNNDADLTRPSTSGQENVHPDEILCQEQERRREEREQEQRFQNLESALRQAASIREMSLSDAMSDEERRQRAGDAAMVLMNLLGEMGLDDDEEEEGEEPQQLETIA